MLSRILWPATARGVAWRLFVVVFILYNANGREMGTYDSQPTKFAAREFALYGSLTLDRVVFRAPDLGKRAAFQRDLTGHYRSAYSVVPSLEAAIPAALLHATRLVDLRAPLAPAFVSKVTASVLTALGVALTFLAIARTSGLAVGTLTAVGLGLGTNVWPLAAGTLWQLETVIFGLGLCLYGWLREPATITYRAILLGAAGLALAATTRPQIAPMAAVLLLGLCMQVGVRRAASAGAVLAGAAALLMTAQWRWFGHVLGATSLLQAQSVDSHQVTGMLNLQPWVGAAGLLVSPNRGLLIFSPVVLVAVAGIPLVWRGPSPRGERWWTAAAVLQFACYSCYSMWWGGHTYGPRYLIDLLVPLAPAAAAGIGWLTVRRWRQIAAAAALAFSILVAGTGAFCYPHDEWNQDPDVDVNHERLWDWYDLQIVRCWQRGPSPQNFGLFAAGAIQRR